MLFGIASVEAAHLPGIDPGDERRGSRRQPAQHRRVQKSRSMRWVSARVTAACPIQTCWLAQPSSCARRPASPDETASIARHRPRHWRQRDWRSHTTIRSGTPDADRDRPEKRRLCRGRRAQILPRSRRARQSPARGAFRQGRARRVPPIKGAARYLATTAHWQRSGSGWPAACAPVSTTGNSAAPEARRQAQRRAVRAVAAERRGTASASRTP